MPDMNSFLGGVLKGFSELTAEERKRTRDAEEAEYERRQKILGEMARGVEEGRVDPSHYAQILRDQMSLSDAKTGKRKPKGGVEGFFGGTESPMLPFLDAIARGEIAGMAPDPQVGPRQSFSSAIPSLNDAGVAAPTALPPPPPPRESVPRASFGPQGPQAPFNSPRLTIPMRQSQVQPSQVAGMPQAPTQAGPRPLFVNPRVKAVEDARVRNTVEQALKAENLEATIALAVENGATPEEVAQLRRASLGLPAQAPGTIPPEERARMRAVLGRDVATWTDLTPADVQALAADEKRQRGVEKPDPDVIPPNVAAQMRAAGITATKYSEITPQQQQTLDAYEKRMRGTVPAAPNTFVQDMKVYDRTKAAGNDFERFAKESKTAVQQSNVARTGYQVFKQSVRSGKPAGPSTQALIMSFGKVLDPGSVVRESEYDRSADMQSMFNRWDALKLRVSQGGVIAPAEADAMMDVIDAVEASYEENIADLAQRTRSEVEALGGKLDVALTPNAQLILEKSDARKKLAGLPDDATWTSPAGRMYAIDGKGKLVLVPKAKGK